MSKYATSCQQPRPHSTEGPMMKKELKRRWIDALRSGDYAQGGGYLHKDGKWCCLGVLCDLSPDVKVYEVDDAGITQFAIGGSLASSYLPAGALKVLGLTINQGSTLTGLNDLDCKSFGQIADWIDKNVGVT